jgi:hypothetical protein
MKYPAAFVCIPASDSLQPKVTGQAPLTSALRDVAHGYSYDATPVELTKQSYVEEEFFIAGGASICNTPDGQPATMKGSAHIRGGI